MSKYWKKAFIFGQSENKDFFVSREKPEISEHPFNLTHEISNNLINKLSIFYTEFYKLSDTSIIITEKLLNNLSKISNFNIFMDTLEGKIAGNMLDIPTRVKYKGEEYLVSLASYLCLDKKYLGQGYGFALIQSAFRRGFRENILGAYFINNSSRCDNSIKFNYYKYILNSNNLNNFYPKSFYNSVGTFKNTNISSTTDLTQEVIISITNKEMREQAYNFYKSFYENKEKKEKSLFYSPTIKEWKKLTKNFHGYMVMLHDQIQGVFFLQDITEKNTEGKILVSTYFVLQSGKPKKILNAAYKICSQSLTDILYMRDIGIFSGYKLFKSGTVKAQTGYINFYNINVLIKSKNFHLPLL